MLVSVLASGSEGNSTYISIGGKHELIDLGNNNKYIIGFEVPKGTENTVNSWKYLREHTGNYLEVNFDDIGKRIKDPIEGKVKYKFNNKDYEVIFKFDTIDSYKDNINFIFDKNVINKDIVNKEFKISEV